MSRACAIFRLRMRFTGCRELFAERAKLFDGFVDITAVAVAAPGEFKQAVCQSEAGVFALRRSRMVFQQQPKLIERFTGFPLQFVMDGQLHARVRRVRRERRQFQRFLIRLLRPVSSVSHGTRAAPRKPFALAATEFTGDSNSVLTMPCVGVFG